MHAVGSQLHHSAEQGVNYVKVKKPNLVVGLKIVSADAAKRQTGARYPTVLQISASLMFGNQGAI